MFICLPHFKYASYQSRHHSFRKRFDKFIRKVVNEKANNGLKIDEKRFDGTVCCFTATRNAVLKPSAELSIDPR